MFISLLLAASLLIGSKADQLVARTSYCPQWAPDGKQLVFYSHILDHWRILKIDTKGSNLVQLTDGPHDDYYPSFSPNADRILFYSNRDGNQEIFSMRVDGTDPQRLTNNDQADRYPRWSPDGTKIGYVCGDAICVMNANGTGQTILTDPAKTPVVSRITWSADGSQIAFYSSNDRKEMSAENKWTLFAVSIGSRNVKQLDQEWRRDSNPHWSTANNKLVVDGHKNGTWESEDGGWEIFRINHDGTERMNLTRNDVRNDWGASWSSDGTRIAYSSGLNDQYEIFIMNSDGTNPQQITHLIREPSFIVDPRDNRIYPTVKIGDQVWLGRNLEYEAKDSWCYGDKKDCHESGRLYSWNAAREACPTGWHLPTDEEWILLETNLGMSEHELHKTGPRGSDQGAALRQSGSSGFDAPISGYRRPNGEYVRRGERAAFWLATEANPEDAWHRDIRSDANTIYRSEVTKSYALSVRCIRTQ